MRAGHICDLFKKHCNPNPKSISLDREKSIEEGKIVLKKVRSPCTQNQETATFICEI